MAIVRVCGQQQSSFTVISLPVCEMGMESPTRAPPSTVPLSERFASPFEGKLPPAHEC